MKQVALLLLLIAGCTGGRKFWQQYEGPRRDALEVALLLHATDLVVDEQVAGSVRIAKLDGKEWRGAGTAEVVPGRHVLSAIYQSRTVNNLYEVALFDAFNVDLRAGRVYAPRVTLVAPPVNSPRAWGTGSAATFGIDDITDSERGRATRDAAALDREKS
jgi:hypothetical protein